MLLAIDVTGNRSGSEMALPASVFEALGKGDTQAVVVWLDEGGGIDARGAKHQGTLLKRELRRRRWGGGGPW